jgi:hypothetical protein
MEPTVVNCRNCGAKLPPLPPGARYVNCGFCHQGYDLGPAPPPAVAPFGGVAPPPVAPFGQPQIYVVSTPSPARYALYAGIPLLLVIVSVTISFCAQRSAHERAQAVAAAAAETATATAIPHAAATPEVVGTSNAPAAPSGGITLSTSKGSYRAGESISITFGRALVAPAGQQYWVTLVRAGSSDSEWGAYQYVTQASRSATLTAAGKPGVYEIRLHDTYPAHSYGVIARQRITISAR